MNYEIGSVASYREILISPLGAIPRPVHQYIPPRGLKLMEVFPVNPFFPGVKDGTGWRAFGRVDKGYDEWDFIIPVVDKLFNLLEKKGYQIEEREAIKMNLLHCEKVYLFVRRHLILREMIVLYPISLNEIFHVSKESSNYHEVIYPNALLDLVVNRDELGY